MSVIKAPHILVPREGPRRGAFGDRIYNHLEPVSSGKGAQLVEFREVEFAAFRFDPVPDCPQLHRVEAELDHVREVAVPAFAAGEGWAVILRAENHGVLLLKTVCLCRACRLSP